MTMPSIPDTNAENWSVLVEHFSIISALLMCCLSLVVFVTLETRRLNILYSSWAIFFIAAVDLRWACPKAPRQMKRLTRQMRWWRGNHGRAHRGDEACGSPSMCQVRDFGNLPDNALEPILKAAIGQGKDAHIYRSVCKQWNRVICCAYKQVYLADSRSQVRPALATLRKYPRVTHVRLEVSSCPRSLWWTSVFVRSFPRALAQGFPTITSISLELCCGWEVLPDLAHFLSHRTRLKELSLKFSDCLPHGLLTFEPDDNAWREYQTSLAALDFRKLTHLKVLTLDFTELYYPESSSSVSRSNVPPTLPVSKTIAELRGLEAFHLLVSDQNPVVQLPAWLGELNSLASLSTACNGSETDSSWSAVFSHRLRKLHLTSDRLLQFTGCMPLLEDLVLCINAYPPDMDQTSADTLACLMSSPRLRKLHLTCNRLPRLIAPLPLLEDLLLHCNGWVRDIDVDLNSLAYLVFNPRLRKLDVRIRNELPVLSEVMPVLEELKLCVAKPGDHLQHDLFDFTPALRSLTLVLEAGSVSPKLGCLTRLARLSVVGQACFWGIERIRPHSELRVDCRVVHTIPWVLDLSPATDFSVWCSCSQRAFGTGRVFCGSADYANSRWQYWMCRSMTCVEAKRLLPDMRLF